MVSAFAAAGAFLAVNLDGVALLTGLFADASYPKRAVFAGYAAANAAILVTSVVGAMAASALPANTLGWTGLAPLAVGLRGIWGTRSYTAAAAPSATWKSAIAAGLPILVSGSDNLAAYTPLLADCSTWERTQIVTLFVMLSIACCLLALALIRRPLVARLIRILAGRFVPLYLILVGIRILLRMPGIGFA